MLPHGLRLRSPTVLLLPHQLLPCACRVRRLPRTITIDMAFVDTIVTGSRCYVSLCYASR